MRPYIMACDSYMLDMPSDICSSLTISSSHDRAFWLVMVVNQDVTFSLVSCHFPRTPTWCQNAQNLDSIPQSTVQGVVSCFETLILYTAETVEPWHHIPGWCCSWIKIRYKNDSWNVSGLFLCTMINHFSVSCLNVFCFHFCCEKLKCYMTCKLVDLLWRFCGRFVQRS